jgi:excisionase family DNA binding protein
MRELSSSWRIRATRRPVAFASFPPAFSMASFHSCSAYSHLSVLGPESTTGAYVSDRLLTARELGELLGVSPETILRWTRRGELEAIRLPGGRLRFRSEALEEWLAARTTRGEVSPTPSAGPTAPVVSLMSPTPEGGEDA